MSLSKVAVEVFDGLKTQDGKQFRFMAAADTRINQQLKVMSKSLEYIEAFLDRVQLIGHIATKSSGEKILERALKYFKETAEGKLELMPLGKEKSSREKSGWIQIVADDEYQIIPVMACVHDGQIKPRTNEFYVVSNFFKNEEKWLNKSPVGTETFQNSETYPCRDCSALKQMNGRSTCVTTYLNAMGSRYKFPNNSLVELFNKMEYGPISGILVEYMIPSTGHPLAPGVHNTALHHKQNGTTYKNITYKLEDCVLDLQLLNATYRNKIDNLKLATIECYSRFINRKTETNDEYLEELQTQFENTPKENGVVSGGTEYDYELTRKHLPSILCKMANDHWSQDKQLNRTTTTTTVGRPKMYFQVIVEHNARCAICKVTLTMKKDKWTDVSFDRLDNNLGHEFKTNLRVVCQLHQPARGKELTHKMFLHMVYVQKHIDIGDNGVRIIEKHNSLNEKCHFCDVKPIS